MVVFTLWLMGSLVTGAEVSLPELLEQHLWAKHVGGSLTPLPDNRAQG